MILKLGLAYNDLLYSYRKVSKLFETLYPSVYQALFVR